VSTGPVGVLKGYLKARNTPTSQKRNVPAVCSAAGCAIPVSVRKKILVVEDDEDLIELLSFNLRSSGFAVGTAADGIEALKKARSLAYDLILLDLMLPELDGFAICEILRRDPATADTPIIILTAVSTEFARLTGLEAGANDYLTKPFSPRQLISRVKELLHAN